MRIERVSAPASELDPKLTFLAMTVGRRSLSARLLSAGTRLSSDPMEQPVLMSGKDILECPDAQMPGGASAYLHDLFLELLGLAIVLFVGDILRVRDAWPARGEG